MTRSRRRAAALRACRDRQIRPRASHRSPRPDRAVDMAANAYSRDGGLSGLATGLIDLDQQHGRLAPLRPDDPRRPPVDGQDGARHQHRLQRGQELSAGSRSPTAEEDASTAAWSPSSRWKCRPSSWPCASSPSRPRSRRSASAAGEIDADEFGRIRDAAQEIQEAAALHRRNRRHLVAKLAARARRLKRQRGLDLIVVDYLQLVTRPAKRAARTACRRSPRSPRG